MRIIVLFISFCFEAKAAHPKNNKHTITPLCNDKSAFDVVEAERVTTAQRGRRYLLSEHTRLTGAVLFGETAAAGGTSPLFDLFRSLCGLDTVTPRKPIGLQLGLGRVKIS